MAFLALVLAGGGRFECGRDSAHSLTSRTNQPTRSPLGHPEPFLQSGFMKNMDAVYPEVTEAVQGVAVCVLLAATEKLLQSHAG